MGNTTKNKTNKLTKEFFPTVHIIAVMPDGEKISRAIPFDPDTGRLQEYLDGVSDPSKIVIGLEYNPGQIAKFNIREFKDNDFARAWKCYMSNEDRFKSGFEIFVQGTRILTGLKNTLYGRNLFNLGFTIFIRRYHGAEPSRSDVEDFLLGESTPMTANKKSGRRTA
jgi:hypothetical protein